MDRGGCCWDAGGPVGAGASEAIVVLSGAIVCCLAQIEMGCDNEGPDLVWMKVRWICLTFRKLAFAPSRLVR